jgi:hypothetical protein
MTVIELIGMKKNIMPEQIKVNKKIYPKRKKARNQVRTRAARSGAMRRVTQNQQNPVSKSVT